MTTLQAAVFDTKSYDRESLQRASGGDVEWRFMDWRLSAETAAAAQGAQAICIFVNDRADRKCLEVLASVGVKHVALRCAGYNGVDIAAATELGLSVTRVPTYSPYAVAEHAVALLLALNRKIPRASNRVHDLNFSLSGLVSVGVTWVTWNRLLAAFAWRSQLISLRLVRASTVSSRTFHFSTLHLPVFSSQLLGKTHICPKDLSNT